MKPQNHYCSGVTVNRKKTNIFEIFVSYKSLIVLFCFYSCSKSMLPCFTLLHVLFLSNQECFLVMASSKVCLLKILDIKHMETFSLKKI